MRGVGGWLLVAIDGEVVEVVVCVKLLLLLVQSKLGGQMVT